MAAGSASAAGGGPVSHSYRRLGQVDGRMPEAFAATIPAAVGVLTGYFTALAARDPAGLAASMQFPFATFEGPDVHQVVDPAALAAAPPPALDVQRPQQRSARLTPAGRAGSRRQAVASEPRR